ncbi:hypothetical protein Q1695_011971 [Nippostrongylus brasiliensis]|nr:hypothetical protein Q1695_011971 [Nippostrongylus brasiliensis]
MASNALDGWNFALFSLEIILNVAFLPIVFLLFYICITQRNLHLNFRIILIFIGIGYLLGDIHRLILVISRMCCIANAVTQIVNDIAVVQTVGLYLSVFGWPLVIVERAIASVLCSRYDRHYGGFRVTLALCTVYLLLVATLTCIRTLRLYANIDMFFMILQIVIVVVSFVAILAIIKLNSVAYRKRHDRRLQLKDRYRLDENIRGGKYIVPVAANAVACKTVFIALMMYSLFFTDIPLGQDTTHLSHAYDLLFAYERVFFGVALTVRSEKFDSLMKRERRAAKVVHRQEGAATTYHNDLRQMWA